MMRVFNGFGCPSFPFFSIYFVDVSLFFVGSIIMDAVTTEKNQVKNRKEKKMMPFLNAMDRQRCHSEVHIFLFTRNEISRSFVEMNARGRNGLE